MCIWQHTQMVCLLLEICCESVNKFLIILAGNSKCVNYIIVVILLCISDFEKAIQNTV